MAESLEQHYRRLLGLEEPWVVEAVNLELAAQRVEIRLRAQVTTKGLKCPECEKWSGLYDHAPERRWRHLDTMQFETVLMARIPRVNCPEHGVKTIEVPWAGKNSRFTLMFEAFAIRVLQAGETVQSGAGLLRLDWHSAHQIMERAVERGLQRRKTETVRLVGIDEKSFGRGQDYVSLMSDLEQSRVLEVVPDRTAEACQELWTHLGSEQSRNVEAVTIDMWEPYLSTTAQAAPQAQIVHDKFHVAKHLNEAVDRVRRAENRQLYSEGSDLLTGTKYVWLKNPQNWHEADQLKFEALRSCGCKVARAWQLKELFREFWSCFTSTEAESFFERWYSWAIRCRLAPVKEVARMLKAHLENLLTYFTYAISNAMTEGFNSKIQSLKHAARGFRTFANFRIRILFFCGRLNLYPSTH
jgi:transposase